MAIELLQKAGDDALGNQFLVVIPPYPGVIDNVFTTVRVTTIEIPDSTVGTYEVQFGSQVMTKPNGVITTPNEFSFTFRNDKNWNVYNGFYNWKQFIANENTGVMATDLAPNGVSSFRVPITVLATDGAYIPTGLERIFEGCWPSSLSAISFEQTSGEPIETTVTMQFVKMRNPL